MKKHNILLIAHDSRKRELLDWVNFNIAILSNHNLYATGTTGKYIKQIINDHGLKDTCSINLLLSGPLGGDAQAASLIATNEADILIFFCDNLSIQAHNSDIQGLTRLASLYNIAFATNRTTADMILTSSLFNNDEYERIIPAAIERYKNRTL